MHRVIALGVSRADKNLRRHIAPVAGIDKPLTIYIARHSFGKYMRR
jgi:hypothetical protein